MTNLREGLDVREQVPARVFALLLALIISFIGSGPSRGADGWVTDRIKQITHEMIDDNNNGIPDSVDLRTGVALDRNSNGIADDGDTLIAIYELVHGGWMRSDTVYAAIWYKYRERIAVLYRIPSGRQNVTVAMEDERGQTSVVAHARKQSKGNYQVDLFPRGPSSSGSVKVYVDIGSVHRTLPVRWHWQ